MEGFNINGKILIGIDHGYGNMKTRHTVFKSGVKCYEAEPSIATSILEYGGNTMSLVKGTRYSSQIRMRMMITIF